jgi:hypothetical protein
MMKMINKSSSSMSSISSSSSTLKQHQLLLSLLAIIVFNVSVVFVDAQDAQQQQKQQQRQQQQSTDVLTFHNSAPVNPPTSNLPKPTDLVYCLICPNGNKPTGTDSISGFQCQDLDELGRARTFTFSQCTELQLRAIQPDDKCGCGFQTPNPTPCKLIVVVVSLFAVFVCCVFS